TVFCGVLDLRTGVVEYSDGGHEPPFLIRNGQSVEMLDKKGGVALGFLPDCAFPTGYIQLRPGDSLILYTDGVNEAFDTDRRMFRPSGIQDALNACTSDSSAEQVVRGLSESLRQFVGAAPQSDDITVLALKYVGTMS
ncbi:MAG TPA: PP2C family protein-serine/threonine phosphatase, partial [Bryobacteraceae bacterium]|nr:PP2C family protein-serine/threonine phosphatase [Bryobacteraceae bacterium]